MNFNRARYQGQEFCPQDLAGFDLIDGLEPGASKIMQNGQEIDSTTTMMTGVVRQHSVIDGLNAILLQGNVTGEYLTQTILPPGLTIFIGFKANGFTRLNGLALPHQTLPNVLYIYCDHPREIEQKTFVGPQETIAIHFSDKQFLEMIEANCLCPEDKGRMLRVLARNGPSHYWRAGPEILEKLHGLIYTGLTGIDLDLFVRETVIGVLRSLLRHISEMANAKGPNGKRPLRAKHVVKIEQAAQFIEENLSGKLTLESVGRQVGSSEKFLQTYFPRIYGDSMAHYILKMRMNVGRIMLASGGMTIQQVAASVGYANQASFTTAFRKYHSMTPREAFKTCL